jgi:hypothetical protein
MHVFHENLFHSLILGWEDFICPLPHLLFRGIKLHHHCVYKGCSWIGMYQQYSRFVEQQTCCYRHVKRIKHALYRDYGTLTVQLSLSLRAVCVFHSLQTV